MGVWWKLELLEDDGDRTVFPSPVFFMWCVEHKDKIEVDCVTEACVQVVDLCEFCSNRMFDCCVGSTVTFVV